MQTRFRLMLLNSRSILHRNFCALKTAEKGHVISYLVNSCGLSPETAAAASKKVHFESTEKPDAVVGFLRKQGFTGPQIAELVRARPKFLLSKPEKSLLPKIEFFSRLVGKGAEDVLATLSRHPFLLTGSLEHRLLPNSEYLKDVIGPEKLEALFRRGSWTLFNFDLENRVIPNVDHLRKAGVTPSCISLALFRFPVIFFTKHDDFLKVFEEVKGMGLDPRKSMFVLAMRARTGKRNLALWDKCYEVYGKWGWSDEDILMAVRKQPNCMRCSEEKITRVLGFVANELGREARSVAWWPNVIFFNMERRIVPRCSVVHLLALKGLVQSDWRLGTVLNPDEKAFLDRYVSRYSKEIPELYDFYLSKKAQLY